MLIKPSGDRYIAYVKGRPVAVCATRNQAFIEAVNFIKRAKK